MISARVRFIGTDMSPGAKIGSACSSWLPQLLTLLLQLLALQLQLLVLQLQLLLLQCPLLLLPLHLDLTLLVSTRESAALCWRHLC